MTTTQADEQKQLETMAHALIAEQVKESGHGPTEQEISETVKRVAPVFHLLRTKNIQEVINRIAAGYRYHVHNTPSFEADIGKPTDGPLWTVVAGYADVDEPSIFHVHARDMAHLTDQMDEAQKTGLIDECHALAIFKGALYSEI